MQLTLFTDYALRTLVFLALQPEQHLSTITEVADRFPISRNHVVKIVHQLGMKGYIDTIRGKHGGIRLARARAEINLGDLIADMENMSCLMDCQREGCRLSPGCSYCTVFSAIICRAYGYTAVTAYGVLPASCI